MSCILAHDPSLYLECMFLNELTPMCPSLALLLVQNEE